MNPDVQAFVDKWAEKTAAKAEAMIALGAARLADHRVENALTDSEREAAQRDSETQWAVVMSRGINGDEGRLYNEALAIADAYVEAHPEQFGYLERFVSDGNDDDHDLLVQLTATVSKSGRQEEAAKMTMFELVRFERKNITEAVKIKTRAPRHGKRRAGA